MMMMMLLLMMMMMRMMIVIKVLVVMIAYPKQLRSVVHHCGIDGDKVTNDS
jgi:hypothetical protein